MGQQMTGMRAAVYVRLSQETAETTSPARQRDACAKLIADRGWAHDADRDVFEDLDTSAYTDTRRPAFDRLLASLDDYDVVVVWKLDRLYRRFTGFAATLARLEEHDVELVSVTESLDTTTPMGRGVAGLLAAQAEQESHNTSVRVSSAQEHLAREGRWRGGVVPFGWRVIPADAGGWRLDVDDDQAALVREAAARLLADESARSVADDWNRRRIPSPKGSAWTSKTIMWMLRHPRLLGHAVWRGDLVRDEHGDPAVVHPPLLDDWTWRRLQASLKGRDRKRHRRRDATLLGGLVYCRCGSTMGGWNSSDRTASYACSRRASSGRSSCDFGTAIKVAYLDDFATKWLLRWATAERLARARELVAAARAAAARPDPLTRRIERLRAAVEQLEDDRFAGLYDDLEGQARYRDRHRQLTTELDEALRRREREDVDRGGMAGLLEVVPEGSGLADVWDGLTREQRRQAMLATVDRIDIQPGRRGRRFDPSRVNIEPRGEAAGG